MPTELFPEPLYTLARAVLDECRDAGLTLVTAESCTGGLLMGLLTEHPGASDVVGYGYVTYANAAKRELLDVPRELLKKYGAVSSEVTSRMAQGALMRSGSDIAVAISGIAGPSGGSDEKPVGLVYIATCRKRKVQCKQYLFQGSRTSIRLSAIHEALSMVSLLL